MASGSKWYGKEVVAEIRRNYDKRINAAGEVMKKELKAVLSVPGRTVTQKVTKSGKIRKKLGKLNTAPSKPGEAPHMQTGALRRSVFKKLRRRKNRVRVGAKGLALNTGVPEHNLEPRPFLEIAFNNVKSQITEILTTPLPDKSPGTFGISSQTITAGTGT